MRFFSLKEHRQRWKKFISRYPTQTFKSGETIFVKGDAPQRIKVIKRGVVRAYDITAEGEERPVSYDTVGEIFPLGWVFGNTDQTQYHYQAMTDVEVYKIPPVDFRRYLQLHRNMSYEMYADIADRFISLQQRIYALEQSKASDKLLHTLLYLGERFGIAAGKDKTRLKLPLTQQEIGNMVGLTRETTSIELKKLERQKIIKYSYKEYTINMPRIRQLLD